ncbi:MAG: 50S ribosomal protein L15 [Acidobacteria bacterium]|nr:MAG: 50S ribosomal protein L15 [Acidobacteriota bacterium]
MAIHIGTLRPPGGAHKRRKRIGQGMGSGHGKTATRGSKGQRSRSGMRMRPGFEGGQMPLQRRLPKRGFTNIFKTQFAIVNLGDLAKLDPKEKVTPELLQKRGLIGRLHDGLKVLGGGDLSAPLQIAAHRFSRSAKEKIAKAGGKAEVISA